MAQSQGLMISSQTNQEEEDEEKNINQQYEDLPSVEVEGCSTRPLFFQNGWYSIAIALASANRIRKLFEPKPDDILLATHPKTGTTWLKSLLFATVNRNNPDHQQSLSKLNPHECVPSLELQLYINPNKVPNLDSLPSQRLFSTHIPFHALPNSIVNSNCPRIVYLCREPKDTFVSLWHFVNKRRKAFDRQPIAIEVAFDHFCKGLSSFGPYWDHVLGYWNINARLEGRHNINVLFMVYEKLMEDPISELKRLADFVGCPFTPYEQDKAEGIVRMCGFDNLSNLEVNKIGTTEITHGTLQNHMLFRRGVVGDWKNHLTPEMARDLDEITKTKFQTSGLIL